MKTTPAIRRKRMLAQQKSGAVFYKILKLKPLVLLVKHELKGFGFSLTRPYAKTSSDVKQLAKIFGYLEKEHNDPIKFLQEGVGKKYKYLIFKKVIKYRQEINNNFEQRILK